MWQLVVVIFQEERDEIEFCAWSIHYSILLRFTPYLFYTLQGT